MSQALLNSFNNWYTIMILIFSAICIGVILGHWWATAQQRRTILHNYELERPFILDQGAFYVVEIGEYHHFKICAGRCARQDAKRQEGVV